MKSGLFDDLIEQPTESPSESTYQSKSGLFQDEVTATPADYYTKPVATPALTQVEPVKPTFKTFSDLTFKEKARFGIAKVTKGWYGGSLGAVAGLIEAVSTGKDFLKGAFTTSTISEELAKDTTFDKNVKKLASLYSNQADITSDELKNTKINLGLNPEDTFVDQLLQGTGYLTNFIATGAPTKMATIAIGFGKYAGAVANSLNVASESLMEAQEVYKEAKANGKSDMEAYEVTRNTLASNALLIGLTNKVSGIFEDTAYKGLKRLFKIGASGTIEGLQEGLQQMVSNYNTDKPLFQGVKDSFLIGATLGVPMAIAFDTGSKQGKEEVQKIIDESPATQEQKQVATDILNGVATEEQKQAVLNEAITNETLNIPLDETNTQALREDIQNMVAQGANIGDIVIALQAEGISQNDAENIVAEVIATPEATTVVEEVVKPKKVEVDQNVNLSNIKKGVEYKNIGTLESITFTKKGKKKYLFKHPDGSTKYYTEKQTQVLLKKGYKEPKIKTVERAVPQTTDTAKQQAFDNVQFYFDQTDAPEIVNYINNEGDQVAYRTETSMASFPEHLRSRKLFNEVAPYWYSQTRPEDKGTQASKNRQELYDLLTKEVEQLTKSYRKQIDERMAQKDDGIEFKPKQVTATREMAVLDDFKKRYKVEFPTFIVDKIIQGQKTKLSADRTALAEGVTDGNTIAVAFDAVANTAKHELIHLTLNNLDQIPELARFSREDILKAQAEKMGEKFTENNAKDIEEQLALDFEAYQNKEYKPNNSILAKFFASISKILKEFRSLIVKSNGSVLTEYYDAVLYGESKRTQAVQIATESNVTKYLIDNVIDYTPMYQTRRVLSLSNGITSVDFKIESGDISYLKNEALKYDTAESFVKSQTDGLFFHGTGEEIVGDLRGGGYDNVFWTAKDSTVAQNYIPSSGISTYYSFKNSDYERNQEIIPTSSFNKSALKLLNFDEKQIDVEYDQYNRVKGWSVKEGVKIPTFGDLDNKLKEIGYSSGDKIKTPYINGVSTIQPKNYKKEGTLFILKDPSDLKMFDMRGMYFDGEEQYNQLNLFKKLEKQGYDGVIINDIAQSENLGNVGHTSYGIFNNAIKKLKKYTIKAKNYDWDENTQEKETSEFKEYKNDLKEIWEKANSQPKFKDALNKSLDVYKESGDITTKILKDLEGKTTVSKQYILDATNRGDVKQVEKDLIRSIVSTESDKVNVKDFAEKVKLELLPLYIKNKKITKDQQEKNLNAKGVFIEQDMSGDANIVDANGELLDYDELDAETKALYDEYIGGAYQYSEIRGQRYEGVVLPDEQRGSVKDYRENVYESPVPTSAGRVHFSGVQNYFGHTRIEDMASTKLDDVVGFNTGRIKEKPASGIRRVIEVQSDLYQKGRAETSTRLDSARRVMALNNSEIAKDSTDQERIDFLQKHNEELQQIINEDSKIEQYNSPTAHFRMIREEIRSATLDGKDVLQFPTGETAMKIEGLGSVTAFHETYMSGMRAVDPDTLKVGKEVFEAGGNNAWIITDVLGGGKFKAVQKDFASAYDKSNYNIIEDTTGGGEKIWMLQKEGRFFQATLENFSKEIMPDKQYGTFSSKEKAQKWLDAFTAPEYKKQALDSVSETFDISGKVDTNNPIYKFYEKEVGRYLKNNYKAEIVTDNKGVTWYEVKLKDEYKGAVVAFKERVTRAENEAYIKKTYPKYYEAIRAKLPPQKASRAFDRAKARLQEQFQFDTTYTTVKIADEMAKAMEVVAQNPDYAKKVALGLEEAPLDVTDTAISLAVAESAKEKGDYQLQADSEKERSLRQSRRGQEIVMEKGRVDENSSDYFIKQVLDRRKELIAQKYKPFMKKAKPFLELLDEVKENKIKKNKKIKSELEIKIEDFDNFLMEMAC